MEDNPESGSDRERIMYINEEEEDMGKREDGLRVHMENPDPQSGQKRKRTSFTHNQLHELEKAFQQNHIPELRVREALGKRLELDEKIIRYWFQNKRQKLREKQKKDEADYYKGMKGTGPEFGRDLFPASGYGFQMMPVSGPGYPPQPPLPIMSYDEACYSQHPPMPRGGMGGPGITEMARSESLQRSHIPGPMIHDDRPARPGGVHRMPHQCCPCMQQLQHTFEQLSSIVPGIKADTPSTEILYATLNYVRNTQSYVNTGIYPSPHITTAQLNPTSLQTVDKPLSSGESTYDESGVHQHPSGRDQSIAKLPQQESSVTYRETLTVDQPLSSDNHRTATTSGHVSGDDDCGGDLQKLQTQKVPVQEDAPVAPHFSQSPDED